VRRSPIHHLARAAAVLATAAAVGVLALALTAVVAPRVLGVRPTIVLSGSMTPALEPGGLAFVSPLEEGADPAAAIRAGEIITFRSAQHTQQVSHRVVAVIDDRHGRRFVTRGDANAEADPALVPADSVVGTVVYHVPYLGYLASWLRRPAAFVALTVTPTALVVLGEGRAIIRDVRSRRHPTRADLHRALQALIRP
jgi:signal peptidase I